MPRPSRRTPERVVGRAHKEQCFELARQLATEFKFTMPYYNEKQSLYPETYYAQRFIVVKRHTIYNNDDDGHGASVKDENAYGEWAATPEDAVEKVREELKHYGYRHVEVYDVERQEQCDIDFAIVLKYNAVVTQVAVAGGEYLGNAPTVKGKD